MTSTPKAKTKGDDAPETVEVEWAYNPDLTKIGTKEDLDVDMARVLISEGRVRLSGRSENHRLASLHAGQAEQSLDVATSGNNPPVDTSGT